MQRFGLHFGWGNGGLGTFNPFSLNPLQWLFKGTSPATVDDKTANELDADLKDSNCAKLSGAEHCEIDNSTALFNFGSSDFAIEGWFEVVEDDGAVHYLVGKYLSDGDQRSWALILDWRSTTDSLVLRTTSDGTTATLALSATPAPSLGWHHLKVEKSGTSVSWEVDGSPVTQTGSATASVYSGSAVVRVGASSAATASSFWKGCMAELEITSSTDTIHYTFSGGLGMGLDEPDVSGNGNDGTWTVGGSGVATLRSGLQSEYHYNTFNGHSKVLAFDGTGYGIVPFSEDLLEAGDVTLEADFIVRELPPTATDYIVTCEADNETENGNKLYSLRVTTSGALEWFQEYDAGDNEIIDLGVAISVGTTYIIKAVRDATAKTITVTVNGSVGSPVSYTNNATKAVSGNIQQIYIGAPSAGVANLDGCISRISVTTSADYMATWCARDFYDTTLPDSSGNGNNATCYNVAEKYIPADQGNEGYDTDGNLLTNPAITGNQISNNSEVLYQQKAANTEFLTNPFWSADGVTYDKKSFGDLRTHLNFDDNVVVCSTASSIVAAWTFAQSKVWTPTEYTQFINNLAAQGCTGTSLVPAEVTAPTGIGPDLDWADSGGGRILFVEDV